MTLLEDVAAARAEIGLDLELMSQAEAKEAYRSAWSSYCLCQDPGQKLEFEKLMDSLQPKICRGPGPEWQAFAETLPGFLELWDRMAVEMKQMAEALKEP